MTGRIESADNSRLKLVRKLQTRKGRNEEKKFVAEGINLVREAVDRQLEIDFILAAEGQEIPEEIISDAGRRSYQIAELPVRLFEKLTDAEHGVGILAVLPMPDLAVNPDECRAGCNVLVLDRLQDPGNMGTVIRTAVAAGYSMILATRGTVDVYSAKVLRATAGMIFDVPVKYVGSTDELMSLLRQIGCRVVVTVPTGGKAYYDEDLSSGVALVIGNEGNGISDELIGLADVKVTIPMKGNIESLNAAVSAAILMYEAVRN